MEMILDKKQFKKFSYPSSKWVVKQQRQLTTSKTHLTQGLLTNIQCNGGSRSFTKETRALTMRSTVSGHWKLTITIWEPSLKPILLQLHKTLLKNSTSTILQSFGMNQIGKVKKLHKCVSCELITNQKNCHLKCHLILFYATTTNHFSIGFWCAESGFYMTTGSDQLSSVVGLRRSSNALPKAKLARKKGHSHCLVVCCPSDPL